MGSKKFKSKLEHLEFRYYNVKSREFQKIHLDAYLEEYFKVEDELRAERINNQQNTYEINQHYNSTIANILCL